MGSTIVTRRASRLALGLCLLIAALLGADTALWWYATAQLARQAEAWRKARIAEGYVVEAGPATRAGWPLRAELVLPDVVIATGKPGQADALAWRAGTARLVFAPWRPSVVAIDLGGSQSLQAGTAPPARMTVSALDLVVPLANTTGQVMTIAGRNLDLDTPQGPARVQALQLALQPWDADLALTGLTLPGWWPPHGGGVDSVALHAHSTVALPPLREPAAAARSWRDSGGKLALSGIALRWTKVDLSGEALLGLDAALQPDGSGTVRITGYAEAIEALAQAGTITRNDARVAGTLLALVSHTGSDGAAEAELPLTLHGGVLSAGAFPLLRMPALVLP